MQSSSPYFMAITVPCSQVLYGWSDKSIKAAREHAELRAKKHKEGCHACKTATAK